MKRLHSVLAVLGSGALVASAVPAYAASSVDTYPETPATNAVLPITHTYHGSDRIKPNILNPAPVCNAWEDYRTTVYQVKSSFTPAGTVSTTNDTSGPISLTQNTSKTQSVSLTVNGDLSSSTSITLGGGGSTSKDGNAMSVSNSITSSITKSLGASLSLSLSWTAGQQIGPYEVPAGYTGEATYGFELMSISGTQQYCKPDGTWSTPTAWNALAPIRNEVKVKLYDRITGASQDLGSSVGSNLPVYGPQPADKAVAVDGVSAKDYDLHPYFTVSSAKAAGYAGSVALRVSNEGTKQYVKEGTSSPVRFTVAVKTSSGPEGDCLNPINHTHSIYRSTEGRTHHDRTDPRRSGST